MPATNTNTITLHTKYPSTSAISTATTTTGTNTNSTVYSQSQPSSPTPPNTKLVSQTSTSSGSGSGSGSAIPTSPSGAVFEIDERYECEVVNALVSLLLQHGPLSLGKLGSMLHNALSNHLLPSALKRQFGGLQKFIRRHPNRFRIGDDHPYNPHVHIIHNQTFAYPMASTSTPTAVNHTQINLNTQNNANTANHSNGAVSPSATVPSAVNGAVKPKEAEKNVFLPQQTAVDPSTLSAFNFLVPQTVSNELLLPHMLYSGFLPVPQLPLLDYYSLLQYAPFAANGHQHALDLETLQLQLLALQAQAHAQVAAAAQVHPASVSMPPSPTHALSALPSPTTAHGHAANIGVPLSYA